MHKRVRIAMNMVDRRRVRESVSGHKGIINHHNLLRITLSLATLANVCSLHSGSCMEKMGVVTYQT